MIKDRITCRTHCILWNSIDKDCEIYGEQHISPRKCSFYNSGQCIKDNTSYEEPTVLLKDEVQDE